METYLMQIRFNLSLGHERTHPWAKTFPPLDQASGNVYSSSTFFSTSIADSPLTDSLLMDFSCMVASSPCQGAISASSKWLTLLLSDLVYGDFIIEHSEGNLLSLISQVLVGFLTVAPPLPSLPYVRLIQYLENWDVGQISSHLMYLFG